MKNIFETSASTGGPLSGLKVLDLTRVLSGPFGTMWLATMGANVIKIENPTDPDVTRNYAPGINGKSTYFPTVNHNKRGITLNLKAEEGKEIFRELVKQADVVIENFRPGVMDKLGLGYEALSKINPGIVYASISGYGTYGPYSQRPGYDVTAQAMSGIMYITGMPDNPPTRVGSSIGDTIGGMNAVVAILAAIYHKMQTGEGQMVETSLVDGLIALSAQDYIRYFTAGQVPERMGNIYKTWTPYGNYKAKDGYYNLGTSTPKFFPIFCKTIGHPELVDDPRFKETPTRVQSPNREQLDEYINAWAADKTVKEVIDTLVAAGVPCAPVNSIVELVQDEHIAGARDMFPTIDQKGIGEFRVTNIPVRFHKSGLAPLSSSPDLGEHNDDILMCLGKTEEEIAALREKGVI